MSDEVRMWVDCEHGWLDKGMPDWLTCGYPFVDGCPGPREVRLRQVDAWPSTQEPEDSFDVIGPPTSPTDGHHLLDHVDARRSDLYELVEVPDE